MNVAFSVRASILVGTYLLCEKGLKFNFLLIYVSTQFCRNDYFSLFKVMASSGET